MSYRKLYGNFEKYLLQKSIFQALSTGKGEKYHKRGDYFASISNIKLLITNHRTTENMLAYVNVQRYQVSYLDLYPYDIGA